MKKAPVMAPFFMFTYPASLLYYNTNTVRRLDMRTPIFIAALLAASAPLSACYYADVDIGGGGGMKDGKAITTSAQSTDVFAKISGNGPDDIVFVTGDTFSIKAEGDAEAIENLRFKVKDGAIIIGHAKDSSWSVKRKPVTIIITAPVVRAVAMAGSGDFKGDRLSGEKVAISIAGSGNIDIADIQSPYVDVSVAGAGDLKLAGKVAKADYSVAGSGNIEASSLVSETVDVSIAGSGDARINATATVEASVAGSGNVTVTGGAKCKSSKIGSGSVNCS
jgi:hypothetical protein